MLTIYFHPSYGRQKRIFFTRKLRYSKFLTLIEFISWKLKLPLSNNFIYSGPRKLQNNLLKSFKDNKNVSFNDYKYENSYLLQYDHIYGKKAYNKIIKQFPNAKVIIGPLYENKNLIELANEIKNNKNLKLCIASEWVKNLINEVTLSAMPSDQIVVLPVGVTKQARDFKAEYSKEKTALVYFKKRDKKELAELINILENKKITFEIFEYGKYMNKNLMEYAKRADFGIVLNKTESQGIATLELLSVGLPLIVIDDKYLQFGNNKIESTSIPYWSDLCGLNLESVNNLTTELDGFLNNLDTYRPQDYINNELTFEVMTKKLINQFK